MIVNIKQILNRLEESKMIEKERQWDACHCTFLISNDGRSQVKRYEGSDKYKANIKNLLKLS